MMTSGVAAQQQVVAKQMPTSYATCHESSEGLQLNESSKYHELDQTSREKVRKRGTPIMNIKGLYDYIVSRS